jgi:hypothetical protein
MINLARDQAGLERAAAMLATLPTEHREYPELRVHLDQNRRWIQRRVARSA